MQDPHGRQHSAPCAFPPSRNCRVMWHLRMWSAQPAVHMPLWTCCCATCSVKPTTTKPPHRCAGPARMPKQQGADNRLAHDPRVWPHTAGARLGLAHAAKQCALAGQPCIDATHPPPQPCTRTPHRWQSMPQTDTSSSPASCADTA